MDIRTAIVLPLYVFLCAFVIAGSVWAADGVPAFPTTEGFGAMTPGGCGGRVIYVTKQIDPSRGVLNL